MKKLSDFVIALIRTSLVPPLAGYVISHWGIVTLLGLGSKSIELVLTFVISGIWYIVFHGLEVLSNNPVVRKWAGIFLGFSRAPQYIKEK